MTVKTSYSLADSGQLDDIDGLDAAEFSSLAQKCSSGLDGNGKRPEKKHRGLIALVIIVVVIVGLCAGALVALAQDDAERTQLVPETTILDGTVDVSGMTAEELEATITSRADSGLTAKVTLDVDGESHNLDLSGIGTLDTQATIDAAFAPYDISTQERYLERVRSLFGTEQETYYITTSFTADEELLTEKVQAISDDYDTAAVDAGYSYEGGKLVTTESKAGYALDVDVTVNALLEALQTEALEKAITVEATTYAIEPDQASAGKAIYVDTSECVLYLYEDGEVTHTYLCTPGRSGYETPTGDFTIVSKVKNPTWTNPHSDWSENMPETIEPGESNPMGLRKMGLSCGGGIFIHGSTNTAALGSPGSHGCIRLANTDVVELFDMVSVGTPVFVR